MQIYELAVRNRAIYGNSEDMSLVRTSIGVDLVHVTFDNAEWLDFAIECVFSQGEVSVAMPVTAVRASNPEDEVAEYVLEAELQVPWEVIRTTEPVSVTFRGTTQDGRYIITERATPLTVAECGDSGQADMPEDVPTIDQWNRAYAQAMEAVNQLSTKLAEVDRAISQAESYEAPVATETSVGTVMPDGETIHVTADGVISAAGEYVLPAATEDELGGVMVDGETIVADDGVISLHPGARSLFGNLELLLSDAFDIEADGDGVLQSATVKASALPFGDGDGVGY